MTTIDNAYKSGAEETLIAKGLTKKASQDAAEAIMKLKKKASLFNFGDGQGGISLSSVLLPLLAAGGAGYIAYNAGLHGSKRRSAFSNIKNYLGNTLSKIVVDRKQPTIIGKLD